MEHLRLAIRNWLNKPSKAEVEAHLKWQAEMLSLLDGMRPTPEEVSGATRAVLNNAGQLIH